MMSLREYRAKSASLADFLPWVALVGPGVVLNKDGSFQRTARFRGPDLDSATPAELVAVTSRLNNALRRLGSGWAVFVEAQRVPAQAYPHSNFPDPVSALVDMERREPTVLAQQFTEPGDLGQNAPVHHLAGEQRDQPGQGTKGVTVILAPEATRSRDEPRGEQIHQVQLVSRQVPVAAARCGG